MSFEHKKVIKMKNLDGLVYIKYGFIFQRNLNRKTAIKSNMKLLDVKLYDIKQ